MPTPLRSALLVGLGILLLLGPSGCYYGQLATGQLRLLWRRQPIEDVLADPTRDATTRERLALVGAVREYAASLGLRVGRQYTSFVDWPGDRVVTTLVRVRQGSLEPVPWRYPFLGQLPYRGYFDRARAEAEAARLRERHGYDVCESAVPAYSTLGWLADPVTSPMLAGGPDRLVETLLHELVHATAFLPGDADFNESVASFIAQQATPGFFEAVERGALAVGSREAWPGPERVRAGIEDRRRVAETILAFRERVAALDGLPDRAERRAELERGARAGLAALPLAVLDAEGIARNARLSDACLALRGTYLRDLPRHQLVYEALGGDLAAMIARLTRIAKEGGSAEHFYAIGSRQAVRG